MPGDPPATQTPPGHLTPHCAQRPGYVSRTHAVREPFVTRAGLEGFNSTTSGGRNTETSARGQSHWGQVTEPRVTEAGFERDGRAPECKSLTVCG